MVVHEGIVSNSTYLLVRSLVGVLFTLSAGIALWQYMMSVQLWDLRTIGNKNLGIYANKIELEFDKIQPAVLKIIGGNRALEGFLEGESNVGEEAVTNAQNFLANIQQQFPRRTIFVGNNQTFITSQGALENDLSMLNTYKAMISRRAFSNKSTEQFVFSQQHRLVKYLSVVPISKYSDTSVTGLNSPKNILGYIGVLLDIDAIQQDLSAALDLDDEMIIASDHRGIIIMSSEPQWLFHSFFNLPYGLKKSLDKDFVEKQLFTHLKIAKFDDDILFLESGSSLNGSDEFLALSKVLGTPPIKIHHLSSTSNAHMVSYFIVFVMLVCVVVCIFFYLFVKAKRAALEIQLEHEKALKEIDVEFKHQQKLATLGMMATSIAHDINQPITAIKTEAKIGMKYLEKDEVAEAKNSYNTIVKYTKLISKITAQLKEFARKRSVPTSVSTNINNTIRQCLNLNKYRFTEENVRHFLFENEMSMIGKIDPYQFQQILNNLIQNACDAMKTSETKQITFIVDGDDTKITVHIKDTGSGIAPDIAKDIFEPFMTSKENKESMGLGLAICKDILTKVGGDIVLQANDANQSGAVFKITILRELSDIQEVVV